MKNHFLLIVGILLSFTSIAQQDKRLKGIEKELEAIRKETKTVGFSVAVVEKGKVIYTKGFGYRDLENKTPVDENTLFSIGSCSKAFTCGLLGQLREEKLMTFDEKPSKYIPELKFYNNDLNNNVKIKDLMCHRTGLPRHDFSWYYYPSSNRDSLLKKIQYFQPSAGVREKWQYNNFMFLTQSVIAERITNKSWEDNIRERIFEPLGMTRSNISVEEFNKDSNSSLGYIMKNDSIIQRMKFVNQSGMSAAGGINSSSKEIANWMLTWVNGGMFEQKEILPANYVNEAMSSHEVVVAGLPSVEFPQWKFFNYGYGWFISSYYGHYTVEHGGNADGFSAISTFYPSDSLGIVVLSNQAFSALPDLVRNILADRMLEINETDWLSEYRRTHLKTKEMFEKMPEKDTVIYNKLKPITHKLEDYVGSYLHSGYGKIEINNQNDSLIATVGIRKFYLKHSYYNIFEPIVLPNKGFGVLDIPFAKTSFTISNNGEIAYFNFPFEEELAEPIKFKKEINRVNVSIDQLKMYVGEYDFVWSVLKVHLNDENHLIMKITDQPEIELLPVSSTEFYCIGKDGFKLEFVKNKKGKIETAIYHQPNVSLSATRK